jgi:hypothetical protein
MFVEIQVSNWLPVDNISDPRNFFRPTLPHFVYGGDVPGSHSHSGRPPDPFGPNFRMRDVVVVNPLTVYDNGSRGLISHSRYTASNPGTEQFVTDNNTCVPPTSSLDPQGNLTTQARTDPYFLGDGCLKNAEGVAPFGPQWWAFSSWTARDVLAVSMRASAADPLIPGAPNIDWEVTVEIDARNPQQLWYESWGAHDGFPAYDVFVGGDEMYYYPPPASAGPEDFAPPLDRIFSVPRCPAGSC